MSGKRRLSPRALRLLFALGILKGKGSGKNRTVTYDKKRAQTVSSQRGSGTGGKAKADHSATRATRVAAGRARANQALAGDKGLNLVKAVRLHEMGRTKQAAAAATASGLNPRTVASLGNRSKTTGRSTDWRRASYGEFGQSALRRESGRPITRASIQATGERWQGELATRKYRSDLKKALKGIGPMGGR